MKLDDSLVHSFHQPSIHHPGNKLVTCELRMPVQNLQEGDYHLLAAVQPSVPERSDDDLVYADYPSNLKLSTVTLSYQMSKSTTFSVETGSDLQTELDITGNPPPNRFILTLRTSKKSNILTIPNGDYNVSSSNRKLTLTLKDVGKSGLGFGYYTFHASNGINGTSPELKYTFKVTLLEEGDDDNSARKVGILLAIGLNSALMIFSIFGCVLLCRRNRRRKLQSRGSNYASPNEACYIYPNMGFQPDPNEYGSPQNPPSYESVYATPNECMESDSTPQAARHGKRQEVPRGSTGTASQCGELAVRLQ
ncbi:hypothetical protein PoB_006346500 [Plakobranchus ocellatus]|uniref:Uncharacterized protein n=1 Tax=Plakobranchus ocellatus TaxID=259542 RepID=A0AAV4CYV3_9GAST|nr:hypothetical protein PoB_006346500 [Plakobranchus ocellatus]